MDLKLSRGLVLQSQGPTTTRLNFHFSLVTNPKLLYLSAKTVWFEANGDFINGLKMTYIVIFPWIQNLFFQKTWEKKNDLIWSEHSLYLNCWSITFFHAQQGKFLKKNTLWQKVRESHIKSCPCAIIWNRQIWNQFIECKLLPILLWITKCSRDFWDM